MESKNNLSNIKCTSINILNHINKGTKIIYTIEIKLNNNQKVIIKERYSELLNLHNLMSKECKGEKLPNFPPKKFFFNKEEIFVNQRQNALNSYYKLITSSDKFVNLSSFKKWIKNKFSNIQIKKKENLDYYFLNDNIKENDRQEEIECELNKNIIPRFIYMNDYSKKQFSNKKHEKKYFNLIKSEIFPFVENEPYTNELEGNNTNFNFIGNKKNNLAKIEKIFNNKLIEINKNINIECFENFKTPDILLDFEI